MTEKYEVQSFLEGLGANALEVSETLLTMGARGEKGSTRSCPIANALKLKFENTIWSVVRTAVKIEPDKMSSWEHFLQVPVPDPALRFISEFDNGNYPELELS